MAGHEGRLALESWALLKAPTSVPSAHCGREVTVTLRVKDRNTSPHLCLECPSLFVLFFQTQTPLQEAFLDALPTPTPSPRGVHSPPPWYCAHIATIIHLMGLTQDLDPSASFLFFDCSSVHP